MKRKTLKRIYTHVSSFDYALKCLQIIDSNKWKICIEKDERSEFYPEGLLFSMTDACQINSFYFNKKLFKKNVYLVSSDFEINNNLFEEVKSKQLLKKIKYYIQAWKEKLEDKVKKEWHVIDQKIPTMVKCEYIKECLSTADKMYIKKIIKNMQNRSSNIDIAKKGFEDIEEGKNRKEKNTDEDVILSREDTREKIRRIKKKNVCVKIGSHWTDAFESPYKTEEAVISITENDFFRRTEKEVNTKGTITNEYHCSCCTKNTMKFNRWTQSETKEVVSSFCQNDKIITRETGSQTAPDTITVPEKKEERIEQKETKEIGTQSEPIALIDNEIKKGPKITQMNLNFDHLISDSIVLGTPATKRSRELSTVYNELNSLFGKMKRVCGRRRIITPETSYISYRYFEQQTNDVQTRLINHYRDISTDYRTLRNYLAETTLSQVFNQDMEIVMKQIQCKVLKLNGLLEEINNQSEDNSFNLVSELKSVDGEGLNVYGVIGDYNLTDTPQEGSQSIMSFDDDLINSLLS